MTAPLDSDIKSISGIGERKAALFAKLGVRSLRDLLTLFPRAYEDRTHILSIDQLRDGDSCCVVAAVISPPVLSHIRSGLDIIKVKVRDATGTIDLVFFNQPWVKNNLKTGSLYVFYGKASVNFLTREMNTPVFEPASQPPRLTRRILPVYPLTSGLSQSAVSDAVIQALAATGEALPDYLPAELCSRLGLSQARFAYENIHFPDSFESLEIARKRLIFEELFVLSLALRRLKLGRSETGIIIKPAPLSSFLQALPFELTGAQEWAISDISRDLSFGRAMSRIIQGDVGSGKTVVAAAAAFLAISAGYQTALMAPTEILAKQHYSELEPMFTTLGFRTCLLTGSLTAKKKREVREALAAGEYDLAIGTHALITDEVRFNKLGLVITDEQHRFGVEQRAAIAAKGSSPHILVMSATPIPRTLALVIYGDLDISVIDELPPGRQPVETFAVGEEMRPRINRFIRRLVSEGRQVYVVCPLVDETSQVDSISADDRKAVEKYAAELSAQLSGLRVAYVHGRMKQKEKDAVMLPFVEGQIDILVATTVIEVGINVPNASLMVVENAERFGLSQLHQLRGRVGRGKYKSYCVLFSDLQNEVTAARLKIMCSTNDGFKISEEDLKLRGPGDFFGRRQHGMPQLKIASLLEDIGLLQTAVNEADRLLSVDPELSEHDELCAAVDDMLEKSSDI